MLCCLAKMCSSGIIKVIVGRAEYRVFVVRAVERFYWKNVRTGFARFVKMEDGMK